MIKGANDLKQMNVLFVTTELAGYVKVGGLADVSSALPIALRQKGIDVRVLIPFYGAARSPLKYKLLGRLEGLSEIPPCELATTTSEDGVPVYFIVCPALYERAGGPYGDADHIDWPDNDIRFARLSLAAAQIAGGADSWRPDLVHGHDWPAALASGYLVWRDVPVPSVFTVHNLAYQGLFPNSRLGALGIPGWAYSINGVEFHDKLSFLKAGLIYSAHVTAVSPTYAREITREEMGCGLHHLLAGLAASRRLSGIANGIGADWSPEHDRYLVQRYPPNTRKAKQRNADGVRMEFGLAERSAPLFAIVSRLIHQKGVDLVLDTARAIVAKGGQLALIGQGDRDLEAAAARTAALYPDEIGVKIAFDEPLSRRMIAGSDFYLMPSRFEPCGLNQMYAQRYGSLPIAHATGGLADTINDGRTGFLFSDATAGGLEGAIARALKVYGDSEKHTAMCNAAMAEDFSWIKAATHYEEVYRSALGRR